MNNIFYSLINLFIGIFFILLGIISAMLPWSTGIRTSLIQIILENSVVIFLFGFCFLVIGALIVVNILLNARRNYYHLRASACKVSIEETVIQDYLDNYWKQVFPQSKIASKLFLKKNKIYLTADLPYVPLTEQKIVLERIQTDLGELFLSYLGYRQPFYLSASFQSET